GNCRFWWNRRAIKVQFGRGRTTALGRRFPPLVRGVYVYLRLYLLLGVRQETAHHLLLPGVRPAVLLPGLLLPPRGPARRGAAGGTGGASGRKPVHSSGISPLTRISLLKASA